MAKINQYSAKEPCYFCGTKVDIGKEHAPPDTFFKGTGSGRLTVPSCPEHNGEKSDRDFAVFCSMLMCVQSARDGEFRPSVPESVSAAIERVRPNFGDAKRSVAMSRMLVDPPDPRFDIELPYTEGTVNILNWMTHLTAALVWTAVGRHECGTDWGKARSWSPVYFEGPLVSDTSTFLYRVAESQGNLKSLRSLTSWRKGWQPSPPYPGEIFRFEVFVGPAVIFKHVFFGNLEYYTGFMTAEATKQKIDDLLG
jgi:hypothetical protein